MANTIEVKVPDIGNYTDVPVIEVLVKPGDTVAKDQGLVTLESDKATMEVPSPARPVSSRKCASRSTIRCRKAMSLSWSKRRRLRRLPKPRRKPLLRLARLRERPPRKARRVRASVRRRLKCRPHPSPLPQAGEGVRRRVLRRLRKVRRSPGARPTSNARSSCSAPDPAATPPRSAQPISARTPC